MNPAILSMGYCKVNNLLSNWKESNHENIKKLNSNLKVSRHNY